MPSPGGPARGRVWTGRHPLLTANGEPPVHGWLAHRGSYKGVHPTPRFGGEQTSPATTTISCPSVKYECPATVKRRAEEVFKKHLVDNLVISAGSGVTSSGIVQAFAPGSDLFSNSIKQAQVITVSNQNTINKKYKSHSISSGNINVYKSQFEFDDMMEDYEVPFPCNGTWDRKAWKWLENYFMEMIKDHIAGKNKK